MLVRLIAHTQLCRQGRIKPRVGGLYGKKRRGS